MNIDEFPSLDFLLPYTGNALQTKLLLGAAAGLVFGITLLLLSSVLVVRVRRNRRARCSASDDASSTTTVAAVASSAANNHRHSSDRATAAIIAAADCDADLLALGSTNPPLLGNSDKCGSGFGVDTPKMRAFAANAEGIDGFDTNPDIIPMKGN